MARRFICVGRAIRSHRRRMVPAPTGSGERGGFEPRQRRGRPSTNPDESGLLMHLIPTNRRRPSQDSSIPSVAALLAQLPPGYGILSQPEEPDSLPIGPWSACVLIDAVVSAHPDRWSDQCSAGQNLHEGYKPRTWRSHHAKPLDFRVVPGGGFEPPTKGL